MNRVVNILTAMARQKDVMLIMVFVTILLMMILPLPTLVMDVLITLNISASIIIMLMTLHLQSPIQFSTFPSLLLVTTLFRLAISISTTRLILIDGDAGQIVETFGNVVVGGNLVVGLVIFLIITVVQFLVITKGADRVAEVGARFTLDGMPGKQMSVDADVRAGSMDQVDAKSARQDLDREAKLFGAMDGAMKFVKGDAMAGLVITAINLLGGIAIGMAQLGYGFQEALTLYALMTIGDGLVAQIPALLISVSAGTIVTRVTNPNGIDLGTEISDQIVRNHRTIILAGLVIAAFGFIPGFPTLIFLAVGLAMSAGIIWNRRRSLQREDANMLDWRSLTQTHEAYLSDTQNRTGQPPALTIVLPGFFWGIDTRRFYSTFETVNTGMAQEFGVPLGTWRFTINDASATEYKIIIGPEIVAQGHISADSVFVKSNLAFLDTLGIPHAAHFGNREGAMVPVDQIGTLIEHDIKYWDAFEQLIMELKRVIVENLRSFLTFQATSGLLDKFQVSNATLIGELRENLSTNQIATVLRSLVQERVPMANHVRIFEAIVDAAPKRPEPFQVLQQVRIAMGDFITKRFAPDGFLPVLIVTPTLESFVREGFRTANEDRYLILNSEISKAVANQVRTVVNESYRRGKDPVIIAQQDVRRAFYNLLQEHGIYIPVLAYQEVSPQTVIYPVGFIGPEELEPVRAA